jgi:DNA-directed RNA polymerase specialized sigma24 family protein
MNETPTNPASDEKLMLAFAQGSPEALTELFRRYQQPIHGFFRRRVTDPARAEELMQETFLALRRQPLRTPRTSPHLSLRHCAKNPASAASQSDLSRRLLRPPGGRVRPRETRWDRN